MLATEPQNHNHEAAEYIWIVFSLFFSLLLCFRRTPSILFPLSPALEQPFGTLLF